MPAVSIHCNEIFDAAKIRKNYFCLQIKVEKFLGGKVKVKEYSFTLFYRRPNCLSLAFFSLQISKLSMME